MKKQNVNPAAVQKPLTLFPILQEKRLSPQVINDLKQMLNNLCMYVKGTKGKKFKLYIETIIRINELIKIETKKARYAARN